MADHIDPLPAGALTAGPLPTVAAPAEYVPAGPVEDGAKRTARRVNIRVFIYVIGLHVFAGFAMLLFYAAGHRS
ncbi:DUF6126 family protein [Streptacidiphilus neutrinimicus]|uniref:DUF6126 family protein n=1 Tax=Streptacidiphilus neutrinimicus TaxID=105420 RepID=UPI0005A75F66|nr:DUF6126 family protein [Streptacidiphilus neutrinimicus]